MLEELLTRLPITLDVNAWYLTPSLILLLAIAGLTTYCVTLVTTGPAIPAGSTWCTSTQTMRAR